MNTVEGCLCYVDKGIDSGNVECAGSRGKSLVGGHRTHEASPTLVTSRPRGGHTILPGVSPEHSKKTGNIACPRRAQGLISQIQQGTILGNR